MNIPNMDELLKQNKPIYTKCAGTGGGTDFDDTKNENLEQIRGIVVRTGDIADAIGVICGEDKRSVLHGNPRGGTSHNIIFDDGDSLKSIDGICDVSYGGNKCFSKIKVNTVNGKSYGPFGKCTKGKAFKLEIPSGKMFIGFYGKVDEKAKVVSVNKLGLIYSDQSSGLSGMLGGMNMLDGSDSLL